MKQRHTEIFDLPVVNVGRDGRRSFDRQAKRRLIEACLQPGVSLAGMALKHGLNANLLRKWVLRHQNASGMATPALAIEPASAFVPVVRMDGGTAQGVEPRRPPMQPKAPPAASSRLTAQLPNGITLKLECTWQDATLVSAVIESLGRFDVPASR